MQSVTRNGPRALRSTSRQIARQQPRRHATQGTDAKVDPHTTRNSTAGGSDGSESFGRGFYLTLAALPLSYIVYSLSRNPSDGGVFSSLIRRYQESKEALAERNALHTRMVEQAGHDRNLFLNTRMPNHYELRNPEVLVGGASPHNVIAGQGSADMSALIKHYEDKNFAQDAEKLRLMKEGKLRIQLQEEQWRNTDAGRASAASTGMAEAGGKGA